MKPPYRIKSETVLASGPGTQVRDLVFAPGEATPWHRHSAVDDRSYVLQGAVVIETQAPDGRREVATGDSNLVPAGVLHRVINEGSVDARFILVQHGGHYDFIAAPGDDPAGKEA